ncbi:hypothetical protein F383_01902 [Gossypium arboreum]|uniref:Uncharacterized protein n=1 Tax=Gossypium arboreum TaxID=29729 RepID=A0A0B0PF59_GOSAR|nr:hypothetical protein F383_01902 [Gossypium arboreum]
MKLDLFSFLP